MNESFASANLPERARCNKSTNVHNIRIRTFSNHAETRFG